MARGRTLGQLVNDFRLEIGASSSVAAGADSEENVKQLLRRTQEVLYDDYNWPHLSVIKSKALSAGSRYYDMPAGLNFDRITEATVLYGGVYTPLTRGIGFNEYSAHDPSNDERVDPVLRWDVRYTGSGDQIEVWPLPASAQTLWFEGIQDLPALTSDSDTAALDDQLIILFAAAEMLARKEMPDAELKLAAARQRFDRLKARSQGAGRTIQIGLGPSRTSRSGPTVVRVAS